MFFSIAAFWLIWRGLCLYVAAEGDKVNKVDQPVLYDFFVPDAEENFISLSSYAGKVLLVVNVASECGYTDQHYKELVQLHNQYRSKSFEILAFPCNQFLNQEPGTNGEIQQFAQSYGVNFPVFGKIEVKGPNVHAVYKFLTDSTGFEPTWNFWKYLIDSKGHVIAGYPPDIPPLSLIDDIEAQLNDLSNTNSVEPNSQKEDL